MKLKVGLLCVAGLAVAVLGRRPDGPPEPPALTGDELAAERCGAMRAG